jgi:5-methylcytosine-specific restriction endonuclease McrA
VPNDIVSPRKCCTRCGDEFPATTEYFQPSKQVKSGLNPLCRVCYKAYNTERNRARGHKAVNAGLVQEDQRRCNSCKEWKANTEEYFYPNGRGGFQTVCRQCGLGQAKSRRQRDRKAYAALVKKWRDAHPGYNSEQGKKAYAKSPAKAKAHAHRRRARIMAVGGSFTAKDLELQYKAQKGLCWWCEVSIADGYEADHVVPISRGGSNDPRNIVLTCANCNRTKHAKMPFEWIGRLL